MTNTPQSSQENPGGLEGMAGRLAGSEMFNRITELFSETNPQLDRMKESILDDLNGLRKSPNLESLAINMWKSAEAGLRKDLAELGVSDAETAAAIAGAREKWNAAILCI